MSEQQSDAIDKKLEGIVKDVCVVKKSQIHVQQVFKTFKQLEQQNWTVTFEIIRKTEQKTEELQSFKRSIFISFHVWNKSKQSEQLLLIFFRTDCKRFSRIFKLCWKSHYAKSSTKRGRNGKQVNRLAAVRIQVKSNQARLFML